MQTYRAGNARKSPLWPCAHRHFATFVEQNPRDYQRRISRVGESLKGLWV